MVDITSSMLWLLYSVMAGINARPAGVGMYYGSAYAVRIVGRALVPANQKYLRARNAYMSSYRRAYRAGGQYFFTVVSEGRRPILTQPDIRTALRQAIIAVRQNYPFEISAWVLLPDHLHTIWQLPPNDADYSLRWNQIKRRVTHACERAYHEPALLNKRRRAKRYGTIWQHRFWEHAIRDENDFNSHMNYLHYNPVKHGLVQSACDWPWSSFHRLVRQGIYSNDWGG